MSATARVASMTASATRTGTELAERVPCPGRGADPQHGGEGSYRDDHQARQPGRQLAAGPGASLATGSARGRAGPAAADGRLSLASCFWQYPRHRRDRRYQAGECRR